jgi:hypothetical protein
MLMFICIHYPKNKIHKQLPESSEIIILMPPVCDYFKKKG